MCSICYSIRILSRSEIKLGKFYLYIAGVLPKKSITYIVSMHGGLLLLRYVYDVTLLGSTYIENVT